MTTRNLVPRADGEGSLGTAEKQWGAMRAKNIYIDGVDVTEQVTETTNKAAAAAASATAAAGSVVQAEAVKDAMIAAYGYPLTAATAADMTDTTKLYVYTGSETGYTFGDWYYHNGTAWTDGGVYNAIAFNTDPTLTVEGDAADALVTGVRLNHICYEDRYTTSSTGWVAISINTIPEGTSGKIYVSGITSGTVYIQLKEQTDSVTSLFSSELTADGYVEFPALSADAHGLRIFRSSSPLNIEITYGGDLYRLDNRVGELEHDINNIDSIYAEEVPDALRGIVGLAPIVTDISDNKSWVKGERFRVQRFACMANGFYLYVEIALYLNDSWVVLDNVSLTQQPSSAEKILILKSSYRKFLLAVNTSLLTQTSLTTLNKEIKKTSVQYFVPGIYDGIKDAKAAASLPSFFYKDYYKATNHIDVNPDGTGDFTTIGAAYASITGSAFDNQYEIRVFPGEYHEVNLIPPPYTHTHGLRPSQVVVTSVGVDVEEGTRPPVFDLSYTSKLSNMKIISAYGYCVHFDAGIGQRFAVCKALHLKKVYNASLANPEGDNVRNYAWYNRYVNPSVVGMGMGGETYRIDYEDCVFENGEVATHTNANNGTYPDCYVGYDNCKLVNAYLKLQIAGTNYNTNGMYQCNINNLLTMPGCKSLKYAYRENEKPWLITGQNSKNFLIEFAPSSGSAEAWECINTSEKTYIQLNGSVTKGQFVSINGTVCANNSSSFDVFGIALSDGVDGDTIPVWVGNAINYTGSNGEYGIGDDGGLSASVANKVGRIYNNIFYRY